MSLSLLVIASALLSHCGINAIKHHRLGSVPSHPALLDQSVIDDMSQTELQRLIQQMSSFGKSHDTCKDDFQNMASKIIRTKDSIENGAIFLSALPEVASADECQEKCCHYSGIKGQTCDVAVYQLDRADRKTKCFLFSCYVKSTSTKSFLCSFSINKGFISFKRKDDMDGAEQVVDDDLKMTSAVKTTTALTSTSASSTANIKPTSPMSTISNQGKVSECGRNCNKFEWKCDDGCCISGHSTCDGAFQCSDHSDEIGCPTFASNVTIQHPLSTVFDHFNTTFIENKKSKVDSIVHVMKIVSNASTGSHSRKDVVNVFKYDATAVSPEAGAVLPLAIGLAITGCVLLMVACRMWVMKRKLRKKGKPLTMDEADYLINGMYL